MIELKTETDGMGLWAKAIDFNVKFTLCLLGS